MLSRVHSNISRLEQEGCVNFTNILIKQNTYPVRKRASYFLAHIPGMVRYGLRPSREIEKDTSLITPVLGHLCTFDQAVDYLLNSS